MHPRLAAAATRVEADIRIEGSLLLASFSVHSPLPSRVNPAFPTEQPQWGLWDWDVVELFVHCGGNPTGTPYYEFQVSPLGQYFELEVLEPRKVVNRDFRSGVVCSAKRLSEGSWEGEIRVSLDRLGWHGDPSAVRGNAFAILGAPEARTYWSLFLDPQDRPDFHLPEKFKSLV